MQKENIKIKVYNKITKYKGLETEIDQKHVDPLNL